MVLNDTFTVVCIKCWGGGVLDKEMTQESGFLSKLNKVMAQKCEKDQKVGGGYSGASLAIYTIFQHQQFQGGLSILVPTLYMWPTQQS